MVHASRGRPQLTGDTRDGCVSALVSQTSRGMAPGCVLNFPHLLRSLSGIKLPLAYFRDHDNTCLCWLFLFFPFLTSASWDHLPTKRPTLPQVLLLRKPRLKTLLMKEIKNMVTRNWEGTILTREASLRRW